MASLKAHTVTFWNYKSWNTDWLALAWLCAVSETSFQVHCKRWTHSGNSLDAGRNISLLLMTYYYSSRICMSSGCRTWRRPGEYRHSAFFVLFCPVFLITISMLSPFPAPFPYIWIVCSSAVEPQLSGLTGTTSLPDIWIFVWIKLHWSFKWGKNSTNCCCRLHIYLHRNETLIHNSLYVRVFDNCWKI